MANVNIPGAPHPPAFERLLKVAENQGLDTEQVQAMHRLLNLSDSLPGYIRRLRTIKRIEALEIEGTPIAELSPEIASWTIYIDAVLLAPSTLADAAEFSVPEKHLFLNEEGKDPLFRRGMLQHGLEALLWMTPPDTDPENIRRFVLLQAQMTVAHMAILSVEHQAASDRGIAAPSQEIFNSTYQPCMFARKFTRPDWIAALRFLPLIIDSASYADAFCDLRSVTPQTSNPAFKKMDAAEFGRAVAGICSFIERGAKQGLYHKRAFHGRQTFREAKERSPKPTAEPPNREGNRENGASEFTLTVGSPALKNQLDRDSECPEDHFPIRTFILTDGGPLAATHVLAAKARENQMLPWRYREPRPRDFATLVDTMRAHPEQFDEPQMAKETIAWSEFLFFQGCSANQATELLVGFPSTPTVDCDFMLRIAEDPNDDGAFPPRVRVRVIEPPYTTEFFPIEGERSRVNYFEIPDLGGVCHSVREVLRELQRNAKHPEAQPEMIRCRALKIFSHGSDSYADVVSTISASLGLEDRVDASGLGKVMFQRFVESGDIASAALLGCSEHRLASVRRWYFTPTVKALRHLHERAVESVFLELPDGWKPRHRKMHLEDPGQSVGSRRCAVFEHVHQLVGILQSIVYESSAVRTVRQRNELFVRKHNALTMLAVWVVDLSVGMRNTDHPYFHASEYDPITGIGSFADKGEEKARSYCLSRLTIETLRKYDQYLEQLTPFGLPGSTLDLPCYFVQITDERLEPVGVTPKSISLYLGDAFGFAPNWGRRLVKTLAIEGGFPAIFTDAYCGHSNYGQELYYAFSSFDPLPYFEKMSGFIERLLQELGFTPLTFDLSFLEPSR